jgi:ribose transport system permease protein
VLLGGASLSGGVGSALGSLGGLLCIGLLGNGLNLFDVPAYFQRIAQGLLLLLLVVLESIAYRRTPVSRRGFTYRLPSSR